MTNQSLLKHGPLMRKLCERKDGQIFRESLDNLLANMAQYEPYDDTIPCTRTLFGQAYDIRFESSYIPGGGDQEYGMSMRQTLYLTTEARAKDWDGFAAQEQIGFTFSRRSPNPSVEGMASITLTLPIDIPETMRQSMIDQPLGQFIEGKDLLKIYKAFPVAKISPAFKGVVIELQSLGWMADINHSLYSHYRIQP